MTGALMADSRECSTIAQAEPILNGNPVPKRQVIREVLDCGHEREVGVGDLPNSWRYCWRCGLEGRQ